MNTELFRVTFKRDKTKELTPYEFICVIPSKPKDVVIPIGFSIEENLKELYIRLGVVYSILKEISKLIP